MALRDRFLERNIDGARVLVRNRAEEKIGKVIVRFEHKRALQVRTGRPERMGGNFDALAASEFADRFRGLCFIELKNKAYFLAVSNNVVAVSRNAYSGLIER